MGSQHIKVEAYPFGRAWYIGPQFLKRDDPYPMNFIKLRGLSFAYHGFPFSDRGELHLSVAMGESSDGLLIHELPIDIPALNPNDGIVRDVSTSTVSASWRRYFEPRQEAQNRRFVAFDAYLTFGMNAVKTSTSVTMLSSGFGQLQREEKYKVHKWALLGRGGFGVDLLRVNFEGGALAAGAQMGIQVGEALGADLLLGLSLSSVPSP